MSRARTTPSSADAAQLREVLVDAGLHVTPSRLIVLDVMRRARRTQSHADLESALAGRHIDRVTLYRTLDKLTEAALKTSDQAERAKLYDQAIRFVVDEAANIFVYNTKWFGPYSNKIDGIRFSPVGNGQEMRWAYFK